MQVSGSQANVTARVLYESMSQDVMIRVVRQLWPGYDLHHQCGVRDIIPIPLQDAAKQIVRDIISQDLYVDFVEILLKIDQDGIMGRHYPIPRVSELVKLLREKGFVYDRVNNSFLEDPRLRRTQNWGRLKAGTEYNLALLRVDLVANSKVVRKNHQELVEKTFEDIRNMVRNAVEKRLGRIWSWEGDGGLAAFYYGHRQVLGVYSALEILQKLWSYNFFTCPLKDSLEMRLALHSGYMRFSFEEDELRKSDVFRNVVEIESHHTPANHLVISSQIETSLDRPLASLFHPLGTTDALGLSTYALEVEP